MACCGRFTGGSEGFCTSNAMVTVWLILLQHMSLLQISFFSLLFMEQTAWVRLTCTWADIFWKEVCAENTRKAWRQGGAPTFAFFLVCITTYVFMSLFQRYLLSYNLRMFWKIVMIHWAMESVPNEVQLATVRSKRMKENVAEHWEYFAIREC